MFQYNGYLDNPRNIRIDRRYRAPVDWQYWPDVVGQQGYLDTALEPDHVTRPEVEEEALIAWGLAKSEASNDQNVNIDVLLGQGTDFKWKYNVKDNQLGNILRPLSGAPNGRSLRMCFINTLDAKAGWLPGNFDIRPRVIQILLKAGLSKSLLTNIYNKQGYWAKMGNQRIFNRNEDERLTSLELCYQYRCGWDTGVSFIHLVRTQDSTLYFCINFPAHAMRRLENVIRYKPALAHRDFLPDALVANDSLQQWQLEIGRRRDKLQSFENQYKDHGKDFGYKRATIRLHKLARHFLTLGQDVQDFQAQLSFLRESYRLYKASLAVQTPPWIFDKTVDMGSSFDMLASQCDTCIRWTSVYHDRTSLRINLLFHLASQRESRTNTEIAASSAEIARQTQRDSASMITIAAVTMLFLPGTFICSVLSTTFFDYGDDGLRVSAKWWVLLVSAIPLTVLVFAVWLGWVRLRRRGFELLKGR